MSKKKVKFTGSSPETPAAAPVAQKSVAPKPSSAETKVPKAVPGPVNRPQRQAALPLPFQRHNYLLLLGCTVLIVLGFLLLASGGFVDAREFSLPLHVAPFVLLAGFGGVIVAIMRRKPNTNPPA